MTDTTVPETPQEEANEPSPFQVAIGFFILPLLLVLGGVGVFLLFGVLAHEATDPADYLPAIMGGGINEPWQAAFHLSQQLQFDEDLKGDPEFASQVIRALERAGDSDPRVRRFLTIALGRIGHPSATEVLAQHTGDEDAETRVNSIWAIGSIGDRAGADAVAERLGDDDSQVRTMAAYVLGVLGEPSTGAALQVALNDQIPAVRWNSAVALGLMDNPAGLETLGAMIDREYLATVPGITEQDYVQTMLAALTALQRLGPTGYEQQLITLRDSDPDMRVRQAAREALTTLEG